MVFSPCFPFPPTSSNQKKPFPPASSNQNKPKRRPPWGGGLLCMHLYSVVQKKDWVHSGAERPTWLGHWCKSSTQTCTHTYIYIDMNVYVYIYVHMRIHLYVHIYIHMYIYIFLIHVCDTYLYICRLDTCQEGAFFFHSLVQIVGYVVLCFIVMYVFRMYMRIFRMYMQIGTSSCLWLVQIVGTFPSWKKSIWWFQI